MANEKELLDEQDSHSAQDNGKPNAWRVEDDDNLNEQNLERSLITGKNDQNTVKEGTGMGGQNFGRENNTPTGDDKNNPSQNAGYTNAYFARTKPSEEHPENSNFKDKNQEGSPDYSSAQAYADTDSETPKPEKVERGNGKNDRPHKGDDQEQTNNNDEPNIPGPGELPDQQKVGEDSDGDDDNL